MKLQDFLLPDDDTSLRVGRVVLAAARLEMEARHYAGSLGAKRTKVMSLGEIRRSILKLSADREESEYVAVWIEQSYRLWGERGRLAHGAWLDSFSSEGSRAELFAQRDWDELPTDAAHLNGFCADIFGAILEGMRLHAILLDVDFPLNPPRL